jgi:uncharacterized protein YndB with AHSA1/START domain
MPDILFEVPIAAPIEKAYRALIDQEGLARWWTPEVSATPEPGSIAEFTFHGGSAGRFIVQMHALELGTSLLTLDTNRTRAPQVPRGRACSANRLA